MVMHLPEFESDGAVRAEEVSLFVGKGFLVSFYGPAEDPFEPVRERLRKHIGRIRRRSITPHPGAPPGSAAVRTP